MKKLVHPIVVFALVLVALAGLVPPPAQAAVSISLDTPYIQDFDGIGTSATATLPADWRVSKDATNVRTVGSFASATSATERQGGNNMATTASNGIYNYGAGDPAAATDRAVGFLSSGTATKSGNLYAQFMNGTGDALSGVSISYDVEKYRGGSNAAGFSIQMYYSFDGATWTSAGSSFLTSFSADANNNGYASAPGTTVSVASQPLNVNIPSGSDFYLAWNYSVTSGSTATNAQGLGIDNFSIIGTAAPVPTNPTGVGTANPNTVLVGDLTLLTVAVAPGTNPPSTGLNVTCDLTAIGGSANQPFYDDGTNGDLTAGDNTISFQATVDSSTSVGAKSLPCTITDTQSRSGSTSISLTVQAYIPLPGDVVISQVYGGGGNSGATYKNDFIELYNRTANTIDLTGWSVQYASGTGTSWTNKTILSGAIQPGKYYLIQEAAGSGGTTNLPTPDATGSILMSATQAKVALVNNSTSLSGSCPVSANIIDFVGYGTISGSTAVSCYEGSGPAPALSNTTAALRKSDGAQDTDNNSVDFITGAPKPRNSNYPFTATGQAAPAAVVPGGHTLLTMSVTPGTDPASTGITVSCNLEPIGGSAAQTLYDDGTNGDMTAGDNIFSFDAIATGSGSQNLACTFADAEGRSDVTSISITLLVVVPIGTVNGPVGDADNGTTHASPYVGQIVTVQGVIYEKTLQAISNSTNTYKGFFIQNTAGTAEGDPNTSDGLFVFMSTSTTMSGPSGAYTPAIGDEIILSGKVSEYYNMTELVSPFSVNEIVRSGVDIEAEVAPVVADPPANLADANRYWERLQGMRVQVPQNSVVLGGRNVFSPADAEIWVTSPDSTVAQRADPYTRRAFRDAHPLDDNYDPNNWDGNGYRILMGSLGIKALENDAQTLIDPARTFNTVTNAPAGGINYTFSKYRIEIDFHPIFAEGADPAADNPPTVLDRSIHYTIVDYNLENVYDYRNNPFSGCDFSGDTGCPQVAPFLSAVTPPFDYVPTSEAVYQARLNDISLQIVNDLHSPDILMVQEVENQDICSVTDGTLTCGSSDNADGKPDVLQDLALQIAANGGPAYEAAFDRDSSDLRGIAPAFLYRTDRVELLPPAGDPVLGSSPTIDGYTAVPYDSDVSNPKTFNAVLPAGVSACETSWVFPRAADVGLFRIYSTIIGVGSHRDVYVINNHFKSGPDSCVGHRTEQAKYNAALVDFIQAANPNARVVVGGDLNVYPRPDDIALGTGATDQLGSLYAPGLGLKNLWEVLLDQAPEAAYSYVYLGMAQTLDQMFVNGPMLADLAQFRIAHINSDFPADYPGDVARGTSDHDPNVATIVINDPPTVDAGGPYTVTEGNSVMLTATGTDPEGQPLTYAWDLDNNGTFETPGQSVTFFAPPDSAPATYTVNVQVTDNGGLTAADSATVNVIYNFAGFFQPVDNLPALNSVNAGRAIPVKFSLGGNKGLNIFATGYPQSMQIACDTGAAQDDIEQTVTAGGSSLSYSAGSDQYNYVWKTEKSWAGTCRQLVVKLIDGTSHQANFKFK